MERDTSSGMDGGRADAVRLALDAIEELNTTGTGPSVMRKLEQARLALAQDTGPEPPPETSPPTVRAFGAFAGQFTIGPEFFEPMSTSDLQDWAAD